MYYDNEHYRNKQYDKKNNNTLEDNNLQLKNNISKTDGINQSIFSFRFLNKERNYDHYNIKKLNHKFFDSEYKDALEKVKDVNPDVYFKHKLDMMNNNIQGLKSKYKTNSNIISIKNRNRYLFSRNLSNLTILLTSLIFLIISFILYYSTNKSFGDDLINSTKDKSYIIIGIIIAILILLSIVYFLNRKNLVVTTTHNKLMAEKCITEIENILIEHDRGSLFDIDNYSILYCEDYNISLDHFNNSILIHIKELIYSNETKLSEVTYKNKLFFKLKYD